MNKMIKMINTNIIKLATPINISYWWNYGSLLGLFIIIQFISGILLSMHYCPNTMYAFSSIIHIIQDLNNGWLIHNIHVNGASMFFICMYIHIGRGLYYHSFNLKNTWIMGVSIFILSMMIAFLGYVLPWGQMSFWGATVITNLVTTVPYCGKVIVEWLWGGYSINNATLNRFFSFHFIFPFILLFMVILHLYFLHETGSLNPLGIMSNLNKVPFNIYFTLKDLLGYMIFMLMFMLINFEYPYLFSDPTNFIIASVVSTPLHIQPEWYFLFAYAILRSIPNKLGGVLALIMSIMILYTCIMFKYKFKTNKFYPINQLLFWMFIVNFFVLTYMGAQVIEYPYINISQILSMMYFSYFVLIYYFSKIWDYIIMI